MLMRFSSQSLDRVRKIPNYRQSTVRTGVITLGVIDCYPLDCDINHKSFDEYAFVFKKNLLLHSFQIIRTNLRGYMKVRFSLVLIRANFFSSHALF